MLPPPSTFQASVETAYERTLMPYNGWISQRSFQVAVLSVPDWDVIRAVLAPSEDDFERDVVDWLDALKELLRRWGMMRDELDLDDQRTSL